MASTKEKNKADKVEYRLQGATTGFGYKVIQINFYADPDKPEKSKRATKPVFHTASAEQGKKALEHFIKKHKTTLIPNTNWEPMLLTMKEKHGSMNFLLNSEQELFDIAYKIVKKRYDNGWYSHFDYTLQNASAEVTEEYVNSITNEDLKKYAESLREKYLNEQKDIANTKMLQKMLTTILDTQNGIEAYYFLREMRGGEYEGFDIGRFDNHLFF